MTLASALDLVDHDPKAKPADFGAAYLKALRPFGAKSIWARSFRLSRNWTDPRVNQHFKVQDHVRIRPSRWWGSVAQRYSDGACPLAGGAAAFQRPFLLSEYAPHHDRRYGEYWSAMAEFGVREQLAVPYFGVRNTATALSIWLERSDFSPSEITTLKLSSLIAMDRLREPEPAQRNAPLSTRERDCLSYVADGFSDADIADRLTISAGTVHTHIENAKRKLDSKTRAQAVARAYLLDGLLAS